MTEQRTNNSFFEASHLSKQFGSHLVLDQCSFSLQRNTTTGLLGKNGAGKTTLFQILALKLHGYSGDLLFEQKKIEPPYNSLREKIFFLPDKVIFPVSFRVFEFLALFRPEMQNDPSRNQELHSILSLKAILDKKTEHLSLGERQRLALFLALSNKREIILLDEPFLGLDPSQILQLRKAMALCQDSKTIFLSSHMLQEISETCEQIYFLSQAKLERIENKQDLLRLFGESES